MLILIFTYSNIIVCNVSSTVTLTKRLHGILRTSRIDVYSTTFSVCPWEVSLITLFEKDFSQSLTSHHKPLKSHIK